MKIHVIFQYNIKKWIAIYNVEVFKSTWPEKNSFTYNKIFLPILSFYPIRIKITQIMWRLIIDQVHLVRRKRRPKDKAHYLDQKFLPLTQYKIKKQQ